MKIQLLTIAISAMIITTGASPKTKDLPVRKGTAKIEQAQYPGIAFFRTHRHGKLGVAADWGVTNSGGVANFSLMRTFEDPTDPWAFWEVVSTMPCSGARAYKCIDNNIFPGSISYRVVVRMIDGTAIGSEISTVRIMRH